MQGHIACFVRYLRQYHEEREGKEIKTQEYFLGKFSQDRFNQLLAAEKTDKVSKREILSLDISEALMDCMTRSKIISWSQEIHAKQN